MILAFDPNRPKPSSTITRRRTVYRQFGELRAIDQRRVADLIAYLHSGRHPHRAAQRQKGA